MIPKDFITEWRAQAPWVQDLQVEQDLVICRALVEIYSHTDLKRGLAFRGGTALYKLYFKPATRYSEDIDLVQVEAGPIGPVMNALRGVLDPWLGVPQWKQSEGRVTLAYRFASEDIPAVPLRLKVEINTREHFSLLGFRTVPFAVRSRWFDGTSEILTYDVNELLGTKMRALYQRKKGRDLLDLAVGLRRGELDPRQVVAAFSEYMARSGGRVTRAMFEQNLSLKLADPQFRADISPLLATGFDWDVDVAAAAVFSQLLALLPGNPWKKK